MKVTTCAYASEAHDEEVNALVLLTISYFGDVSASPTCFANGSCVSNVTRATIAVDVILTNPVFTRLTRAIVYVCTRNKSAHSITLLYTRTCYIWRFNLAISFLSHLPVSQFSPVNPS